MMGLSEGSRPRTSWLDNITQWTWLKGPALLTATEDKRMLVTIRSSLQPTVEKRRRRLDTTRHLHNCRLPRETLLVAGHYALCSQQRQTNERWHHRIKPADQVLARVG